MQTDFCPSYALILLSASLLAGCASSPPVADNFDDKAQVAIAKAITSGAEQHAPLELRFAREKLAAASQANLDGDSAQARRLARQAEVDAELCLAKTEAALAREPARGQREANQQLQAELAASSEP